MGVIGVVAALTIPALMTNFQKMVNANRLKGTYSKIMQGMKMVSEEYGGGGMNDWSCNDYEYGNYSNTRCFGKIFDTMPGVTRFKSTGDKNTEMCFVEGKPYKKYTYLNGEIVNDNQFFCTGGYSVLMPNGACVAYNPFYWCSEAGGSVVIDVDGPYSGTNMIGRDTFLFVYGEGNDQKNPVRGNGLTIRPRGYTISDTGVTTFPEKNRNHNQAGCNRQKFKQNNGMYCGAVVVSEGWKINYKW